VVWQCNSKFKDKTRCTTPHLTEDEIKEAFIRVVNSLITDREEILMELRTIQATLSGTEELEAEQKRLAEQMNVDADAVQEIIAENARVAQDQDEYNVRYNALASRFEDTKAKYEKVTADIAAKGIRRRELERFILAVEKLPEMVTEFDEALWGSLVDHLTLNDKDDIVFTMSSGMEIKV
jgi:predicted nuclease with TOPRIM domain